MSVIPILVFFGGGAGAVCRHFVGQAVRQNLPDTHLFLGTMTCNVSGCLVIGFAAALAAGSPVAENPFFRHFLLVGFLGGYTTFSTFGLETLALFQGGEYRLAAANALLTVVACLLGVALGSGLGNLLRS
jgi:CrcB protein